jgi:glycosyltransferase involved in cell wall biosynthesis
LNKIKLLLSIRSLNIGGAERQFIELVKNIDKKKFDVYVVTMYGGVLEDEIKEIAGIKYFNLRKNGRFDVKFYFRYKNLLKKISPDVIYSWMGEMNLFSYWCKPKNAKLIWGFRASNMDLQKYGLFSKILFDLQKFYSKNVDMIISNSKASIDFHKKSGFFMEKSEVVYNGIDIERFKKKMSDFNDKYNLKTPVIAMVARLDPMKGYDVYCKVASEMENIDFIGVGEGDEDIKKRCKNVKFLGSFLDIENVYNGIDILVSSSVFGEGFSNSIAEAMACEVPCIVTDVGDSKIIVGDTGIVIKPSSPEELKKAIKEMLNKDLTELGKKARKRIEENFSIEKMVEKTENIIIKVYKNGKVRVR